MSLVEQIDDAQRALRLREQAEQATGLVGEAALLAEIERLRELLQNVLDAGEAEAKAEAEMRNAKRNYTNPRPYVDAWERAMVAASEAENEARAALDGAAVQPAEDTALLDWADANGHYDCLYESLRDELRDRGERMPSAVQPSTVPAAPEAK